MSEAEQLCRCAAWAVVKASIEEASASGDALATRRRGQCLLALAARQQGWDPQRAVERFRASLADINQRMASIELEHQAQVLEEWAGGLCEPSPPRN